MSQHLYTCISVFCYWQNAAKLTEQKVRCERGGEVGSCSDSPIVASLNLARINQLRGSNNLR